MDTLRKLLVKLLRPAFALALIAATASVVDAATAAWDPNPEPNIAGYRLSYGTQPGVHDTTIDAGNVTTFVFNPPAGQRYYVVVQAYTTTGELSAKSAEAIIDIPLTASSWNQAPSLVQPLNQSSTQNTTVSLALSASDPDGNILNYSATGLPSGLSLNAATGIIGGTVSTTGTYQVTVTVSDGTLTASRSFTWTVTAAAPSGNRAPTLIQPADQTTARNTSVTLALSASDPDGSALTYISSTLPPGLSINATTGVISGVVSTTGIYLVEVTVYDGTVFASRGFKWTVTDVAAAVITPPANSAPSLLQPPDQSSTRNANVSLQLSGSDPEGTTLTFTANGLPPGLSMNSAYGLIAGVVSQVGAYTVTVTASDGALSASRSFKWTVTDVAATPNRAPSLNNVPDQKDKVGASVSLQLRGSDPDGTPLSYSSSTLPQGPSTLPPGLSLSPTSGLISGVASQVGSYQVTVTVSDGALTASRSFAWTVSASNGNGKSAVSSQDDAGVRFQTAGRLSGVTALQDGRVLLIDNDRSLSMLAPGSSVPQAVLDAGDTGNSLTEVAVNARFTATRHIFVGVITHLDADTSEFSVVRYREVQGSLGEGLAVVGGLRYRGTGVPRFTVDEDERLYVAMPQTERSDAYSASILRFNPDGSVPKENRVASPVFARGFAQPANLGWDGPFLVAIGADEQWAYSTAMINPDETSSSWPLSLAPISVGTTAPVATAAFGVGDTEKTYGMRAFIDSSGRLFRAASDLSAGMRKFEQVAITAAVAPVAAAAGFDGRIYVIVRSDSGASWLLELGSGQ